MGLSAGSRSGHRAWISRIIRIAFALGLTTYALWQTDDPSRVLTIASRATAAWLVIAIVLVIFDRALMAWRWMALLDDEAGPLPSTPRLLRIFFISTFLGTFLPGAIGGDAVRAWSLSRENVAGARALASVLMDRLLGTIAMVLLAVAGFFIAAAVMPDLLVALAVSTAGLGCVAAVSLVYSSILQRWLQARASRLPTRLATPVSRLLLAVRAYSTRHDALALVLVLSIAVNVLRILQAYVLGLALGLDAPLYAYAAFIPIIALIMQLPITVYGLGTTQVAFWWFFARVGMAEADAVALSVLFLGLGLVGALPGGFLYLFERRRPAIADRGAL